MPKFDPKKVVEVKITAIDSDGKKWEIESAGPALSEYMIMELGYMHYFYFNNEPRLMKISGPLSASKENFTNSRSTPKQK